MDRSAGGRTGYLVSACSAQTATACASFGRFGPFLLPLPCSIRPPLATAERLLYMMEAMLRANTGAEERGVCHEWAGSKSKRWEEGFNHKSSLKPSMPSRLPMLKEEESLQEATWGIALWRNKILATLQKWLHCIGRKRERLCRPFQVPSGPFAERQSKLRKLQRPQAQ